MALIFIYSCEVDHRSGDLFLFFLQRRLTGVHRFLFLLCLFFLEVAGSHPSFAARTGMRRRFTFSLSRFR